jgi:hypothetical protein
VRNNLLDFQMSSMQHNHNQGMVALKALVTEFRTAKPRSELFQTKFGDWESVSTALMVCAAKFQPSSSQALRLQELSNCRDSKQEKILNIGTTKQVTKKVFSIIESEFFPSHDQSEQVLKVRIAQPLHT